MPDPPRDDGFEPLPCATCDRPLEPKGTPHGSVWLCRHCLAGAATLGVIRKVAPREFVNHIWQAARAHGRDSSLPCPSCTQPLLTFRPDEVSVSPKLEICCRCFFLWLDRDALATLGLRSPRVTGGESAGSRALALAAASAVAELLGRTLGDVPALPPGPRGGNDPAS